MAQQWLTVLPRGHELQNGLEITMCNPEGSAGEPLPTAISVPSRWTFKRLNHAQAVAEVDRLASILLRGTEALCGLYLRICDTIREEEFTDTEIRKTLSKYFPPARVSEFVRIAHAPEEVYRRYEAGFIGFRAALQECRGYQINSSEFLTRKKIRRAAERLIQLMGDGEIQVCGKKVVVSP